VPTDALVLSSAILAVVLVVSAVGKLRSPRASAEAFRDLRVPAPLAGRRAVAALPWAEIVLAVALVLVGGPPGVVAAVAALVLFTAYLWLVVRALGFDVPVDCACFGEFAPGRITRRTVVRNGWLVALAVLAVGTSAQGSSVAARLVDGRAPWWWVTGAVAAAVTVHLVVGRSTPAEEHHEQAALVEEEGEYLRVRTPALPVTLGDGTTTTLRRLSGTRPQLLVYVSETCGSCWEVIEAVPGWREQLPQLDVRIVVHADPESSGLASTQEPLSVHDAEGLLYETFDLRTPSAVLLGADGLLAGGPVIGSLAVPEFVADVRAELVEALS
jgi:uncharacterized membrane protein YphA (DoxX/SURF4 family)